MIVCVEIHEGLSVTIESEGPYSPDVADDLCKRASVLFNDAMVDCQAIAKAQEAGD